LFVYEIAEHLGPVARELLAAWSRLPKSDLVPDRKAFDPMAIARILPVVSIVERTGDVWRFRLVGTEIERRWGRKLTGCDCIEVVSPEAAKITRHEFTEIVCWPCGSRSQRRVAFHSGRVGALETLRLPLRAADGAISLILGCSGELREQSPAVTDERREIVMITDHQYFDIGAGCPPNSAIEAAAKADRLGYRAMPSAPAGTS
jgi:hypothetical protein